MLDANIGQDVGRTIFVKDFYFNAVSLDTYLLYQTYQSSKWWMCLWWSQSNLSFCSHQIYICFGWSITGDYYWVCLPGKTWLLWSNEKNLLPNPLWGMWHFSDPSLRWAHSRDMLQKILIDSELNGCLSYIVFFLFTTFWLRL